MKIIIITFISLLVSCTGSNNKKVIQSAFVNVKTYESSDGIEIKIVEVDKCEYILTRLKDRSGIYLYGYCFIHKANCKNCKINQTK